MRPQFYILALLFLLVSGQPGLARAGNCSNPTKPEGEIVYSANYHAMMFCNGTTWISMGGGAPPAGALTLISTQTASASASLQFTNLPTSYNTLFLNCTGILSSSNGNNILVRVGEGVGPTWETGAHYTWSDDGGGATNGIDFTGYNAGSNDTTHPASYKLYIDNVGSSTLYKNVTIMLASYNGGNFFQTYGGGFWNNDTNPITGIELVADAGNIASGTCSLYGMN